MQKATLHSNMAIATQSMIKRLRVQPPNELLLAEIYYFTGVYGYAMQTLSRIVSQHFDTVKCFKFCKAIKRKFNVGTSEVKYVELGCYVLYQTKKWTAAIDYLKWLMVNKRENISLWNLLSAHCYQELGDFQSSRELIKKVRLPKQKIF